MKTLVKHILAFFFRIAFWFRYRVTIKGLEKLTPDALNKPGGILFMPNHPAIFIDPTLVTLATWPKFPIRPMIVEYMYYTPVVNWFMRFLDALPIPHFGNTSNSLKKRKSEKVIETVIQGLKSGENFLVYPAGKTKSTGYESIGGASAVPYILQQAPEANVVLVRTKGLWGSSFSRALTGAPALLFPNIFKGMLHVFKNLLFFTPRREVILEFELAPADFPRAGSRMEINRWLENYYNKPDGLTKQEGTQPGDSLILVSYSCWRKELPILFKKSQEEDVSIEKIPAAVKKKVTKKLAEMSEMEIGAVKPEMNLAQDLGMDSLDVAEVAMFLQDDFEIKGIASKDLTTVGKVMAIASGQVICQQEDEEEVANLKRWNKPTGPRERVFIYEGATIPEVFLKVCDKKGSAIAAADLRSGTLSYMQLKMRALLLADYIRTLPGTYIGVLLPASLGAELLVLATLFAGKIPMMINWTVGPRHLDSVSKLSKVQVVLSSLAFLDKLENVDFNGIEDKLVLLEDVRSRFGLKQKLKAAWQSRKSAPVLMKELGLTSLKKDDTAVLLFTSGTESMPKGVPLSHDNLLSNLRSVTEGITIYSDDILLSMLPPFHSFGFTVTGLLPLMLGIRVAYTPDPTDGRRIAKAIERWSATIIGGAPTFIKAIMRAATPEQLKSARFCFTGAEKAPKELFELMTQFHKPIDFLVEGYGITECSPVLTFNRIGEPHQGVGLPGSGVELLIVHPETYAVLPQGEQGLILARGPNVFKGYLNPGLDSPFEEVQGKMWYRTGDLGMLDPQGNLTISGRLKRFIKVGAEMLSLAAIEDGLQDQGIKQGWLKIASQEGVSLIVCAKEVPGEKPKIYLFSTHALDLEVVNRALRDAGFSNLVRISQVIQIPEIPLMGTGKVNYRLLESDHIPKMEEKREPIGK